MAHLVFHLEDGTATAVTVNELSVVNVKTWTPAVFGDGALPPMLVEDQSVALKGVVSVSLGDPGGAAVIAAAPVLEGLSDAEAAALDAEFVTADNPWEDD